MKEANKRDLVQLGAIFGGLVLYVLLSLLLFNISTTLGWIAFGVSFLVGVEVGFGPIRSLLAYLRRKK